MRKGDFMSDEGFKELQQLHEEYISDISLNAINLEEKRLEAPGIKGRWVGQYYTYRHEYEQLDAQLEKVRRKDSLLLQGALKVELPQDQLDKLKAKTHDEVRKLTERLSDVKMIVEALKDYQKLVAFYGQDIRNAIEYLKLD